MFREPLSRQSAERYGWGDGCSGWFRFKTAALAVVEEEMPPGTAEKLHVHERAHQVFLVLEGRLMIEIEGRSVALGPRESVDIPPGEPHVVRNPGPEVAVFLVISAPSTAGDRRDIGS